MTLQRCSAPDTFVGGTAIYQALNFEVKHNGLIHDWTCLDAPLDVLGRVWTRLDVPGRGWTCLDVLKPSWTCLDVTFGHTLKYVCSLGQ